MRVMGRGSPCGVIVAVVGERFARRDIATVFLGHGGGEGEGAVGGEAGEEPEPRL